MDFRNKHLFEIQNVILGKHNLIHIVEFTTWKIIVNNVLKLLPDKVYVQDSKFISNIKPLTGDHKLVTFDVATIPGSIKIVIKSVTVN